MIVTIYQAVLFVAFVVYIISKFGVLSSISESWYRLGKSRWLFTVFCILLGFPMIMHSKDFTTTANTEDYTFLFFLSSMLVFTGAATDFKKETTNIVHFTGAALCILSALLGLWLQYDLLFILLGWLISTIIVALSTKKYVWWIEILSFIWILIGLIIIHLN